MKRLDVYAKLADGTELKAQTAVPDTILWEKTARKNKWSLNIQENPSTWENFLGWAALKRTGETELGYDDFCKDALEISVTVPDDAEVGPTN